MTEADSKVSILVVDDKPEKLLALEAVLEDLGQNIVRAYDGREALRHVLNQEFAVILLDINMPGMDGFEIAQLIRQRRSSAHIPIIFLTAMSDEMHVARGYSLGAVDYILTPVVPQVLRSKVAVFVDLFRKTQQIEQQAQALRRRTLQLQKLATASIAINAALSIDKMLRTITDTAREVIGAHQAITVLFDPHPGKPERRTRACASYSDKYASWRDKPLDLEPVVSSAVARSRSVTRMTQTELQQHPDWEIVRRLDIPPVRGGVMAAPLAGRATENLGIIYVCDRADGAFSADDESILVQLTQMAAIAVENAIFAEERETNHLKDEFLSTLSHELRTPLNAISGWVQLLKLEAPASGDDTAHGLDVIERNVKAQTKLIEELLDLSRITSGKFRLNMRPIVLRHVVESAVDALRPAIEDKGISLSYHLDDAPESSVTQPEDPAVTGDPDRLQQVLGNLLSNALKFTSAGGQIAVCMRTDSTFVRVSVSDSGEGIDPAFLPHVFDRFRQADNTSSRRHGGLGIGLTIVRRITELHGGSVSADSRGRGQGATFTISIPLAGPNSGGESPSLWHDSLAPQEHDESPPSLEGIRVMLVDDEPDAREIAAGILDRYGATTISAESAAQAMRQLPSFMPHVIVTDLAMPGQDGFALLRDVRQTNDPARGTPVIALTAYARQEDRAATLRNGFQAHLTKPVDPDALVRSVHHCAALGASAQTEPPGLTESPSHPLPPVASNRDDEDPAQDMPAKPRLLMPDVFRGSGPV